MFTPGLEKSAIPAVAQDKYIFFSRGNKLFIHTCQIDKGPGKSSANSSKKSKLKLVQGKPNLRAACRNAKLEFKFFPSLG